MTRIALLSNPRSTGNRALLHPPCQVFVEMQRRRNGHEQEHPCRQERPRDNWPLLKPYTVHIHVKDAVLGPVMKIVPPGQGDGDIASIVADAYASGYRGFLTMEPHLKVAGHSHGETGPELFKVAADALKKLCRDNGVPLAGA